MEQFQERQTDKIESYARVPLPFAMKPDFERHVLGWEGTAQIVLFVTLSAPERNFNPENDKLAVKKRKRASGGLTVVIQRDDRLEVLTILEFYLNFEI